MRLLAIDTATEALSAALLIDGGLLARYEVIGRGHAERLLPLVDGLLIEAGVSLASLDAIAFGRGPGAFTGVRIAVSAAQGLAFGADLPVVGISDLAALARQALDAGRAHGLLGPAGAALVCLDARMGEVYAAVGLDRADGGVDLQGESLQSPEGVTLGALDVAVPLVAAGHGFSAYPALAERFAARSRGFFPGLLPRAEEIARLAMLEVAGGRVVAAEFAEPVYLRNDVATRSGRAPGA